MQISTEVTCLAVFVDSVLSAPYVRRLSSKSFNHLWQMNAVHASLMEDAATVLALCVTN